MTLEQELEFMQYTVIDHGDQFEQFYPVYEKSALDIMNRYNIKTPAEYVQKYLDHYETLPEIEFMRDLEDGIEPYIF